MKWTDEISENSIARMAGNIASGVMSNPVSASLSEAQVAQGAVRMARMIAAELKHTRPIDRTVTSDEIPYNKTLGEQP